MKPLANRRAPKRSGWPFWKIAVVLYPFTAGAAAVNVFFLGLIGQAISLPALSPGTSVLIGLALGLPLAWVATRWVERLIERAESGEG